MKVSGFFKLAQNKKFSYTPLYYNADKEERELRNKKIKEELGIKEGEKTYIPDIRGKFQGNYSLRNRTKQRPPLLRLIIMLVTVALVIAVFYLIFHYTSFLFSNV